MPAPSFPPALTLIGLAALAGTALSAMGSLPSTADDASPAADAKPGFRCELALSADGSGTAAAARVTADRPLQGRYDLSLRSGGNVIAQDGDFDAGAGETVTLGEATLPGAPAAIDASLTVTAGPDRIDCPQVGG